MTSEPEAEGVRLQKVLAKAGVASRRAAEDLIARGRVSVDGEVVREQGRPCVGDYVRDRRERLFHVGRLDAETEGLLLLTNDGDLAHRLMHPSYHVTKTYLAEVDGVVPRGLGKRLKEGVELEDGPVKADEFRIKDARPGRTLVEIVLHEGRKHVVRRLLAEVGHPVRKLVRTAVGDVQLGSTKPGTLRKLTRQEIGGLYRAVGL